MAVSQADIDKLNTAIASGARSVTLGDQTVIYNTGDTMIRLVAHLRRELAAQDAASSGKRRSRANYATYAGRGYTD